MCLSVSRFTKQNGGIDLNQIYCGDVGIPWCRDFGYPGASRCGVILFKKDGTEPGTASVTFILITIAGFVLLPCSKPVRCKTTSCRKRKRSLYLLCRFKLTVRCGRVSIDTSVK